MAMIIRHHSSYRRHAKAKNVSFGDDFKFQVSFPHILKFSHLLLQKLIHSLRANQPKYLYNAPTLIK